MGEDGFSYTIAMAPEGPVLPDMRKVPSLTDLGKLPWAGSSRLPRMRYSRFAFVTHFMLALYGLLAFCPALLPSYPSKSDMLLSISEAYHEQSLPDCGPEDHLFVRMVRAVSK